MNIDTINWKKVGNGLTTCWIASYKGHDAIVQPADMGPMGNGYEAFVDKRSIGFCGGGTVHGRQVRARNSAEVALRRLARRDQELAAQGLTIQ